MADEMMSAPPRQARSMIKNLVPRLPERGKIKIGAKGQMRTSSQGNDFRPPVKLSHFRVTTLDRGSDGNFVRDDEIHARLGDEPTEIKVRLLYDDPALNFHTRYASFIGRTMWCSGDGEFATRLSEHPPRTPRELQALVPEPREVTCTCHRQGPRYSGPDKCKINGNLSCIIDGAPGLGGVWNFRTTSYNSVVGLMSSMAYIRTITGGILANIPLTLRIQAKQTSAPTDQSQVTIYVVSLEYVGSVAQLQQEARQIALDRATTHVAIREIEQEARRMLQLAPPGTGPLHGDEADDVVEEFYPEQALRAFSPPPRPQRDQFREALAALEATPEGRAALRNAESVVKEELEEFETIDEVGEVIKHATAEAAQAALLEALSAARTRAVLDAVWENSEAAVDAISNAIEGGAEPLYQAYVDAVTKFAPRTEPQRWGGAGRVQRIEKDHAAAGAAQQNLGDRQDRPQEDQAGPPSPPGDATPQHPVEASGSLATDNRSLAVLPREGARQGTTDWHGTVKDLLAEIAKINDPADTVPTGRFKQQNRQTLELLHRADKRAWSYVEQQLGARYRLLSEETA